MADKPLERGDWVRIKQESGRYRVFRAEPNVHDGSILLYGGDKDPQGRRQFRSVMPERLLTIKGGEMYVNRNEREEV